MITISFVCVWFQQAQLFGDSDVRTTRIYTRTVKSLTLKEARSPLDF
jgi:hypothetical protein